jgi:CubicO group peptidase (beta-lactamase class C family)
MPILRTIRSKAGWALALLVFLLLGKLDSQEPAASSAPQKGDWAVASAAENGLSQAKLDAMASDIRAGKFVKIGSVLVARHGKLVYEGYFEGDAASLRDTRSATKSITDVLVGVAIDEHKLDGVNAKIFAKSRP